MKIKLGSGLVLINIGSLALIAFTLLLPNDIVRIILGVPFVIFAPGFTFLVALFPKSWGLGSIERVGLSFVLSVAIVPLLVLILNYTPWGIRLEPIIYSVALFIFVTSITAWLRQRKLNEFERFTVQFRVHMLNWGQGAWDRMLTIVLTVAIVGGLGMLGYIIATPKAGETFTEFYILGPEGIAQNYPRVLNLGDEAKMFMGIINHEGKDVVYRVEVLIGDKKSVVIEPILVIDDQRWEGEVVLVPEEVGEDQKVEFLLFINDAVEPYLEPLHLFIDVN